MMNPKVTLTPITPQGYTWCYLELDDKSRYEFLYNPNDWEYQAEQSLSRLETKKRSQPSLVYQSSSTTLTQQVFLWAEGRSVKELMDGLVALTRPSSKSLETPWVSLVYGATKLTRLKVASVRLKVLSMPQGYPDRVTGTITYAFGDEPVKPVVEKVSKVLTDRERTEGINKLQKRIDTDPAYAASLGLSTKDIVIVDNNGAVTARPNSKTPKPLGSLRTLLDGLSKSTSTPRATN